MPTTLLRVFCIAVCATWLVCGDAAAYGPLGHRLIALQAQAGLEPAVRAEVRELLDGDGGPGMLAAVASWADEVRGEPAWRHTAPWHYLNFPPGNCHYTAASRCADGECLVAALQRQTAVLADRQSPSERRAEALKFVVHLYGDLHQPLHLGLAQDKGGNQFQISFPARLARPQAGDDDATQARKRWWLAQDRGGYNLHWLWDSLLLDSLQRSEAQHLAALQLVAVDPQLVNIVEPAALAEAGCRIAQQPGFQPAQHRLHPDYLQQHVPIVETQLRLGGLRLAAWLNRALAPAP